MPTPDIIQNFLMYVLLPLWLAAGFADYLCHRATAIESTSGWKESVLHLVQFTEIGVPILAALFLEINAAVILLMIVCLILHQLTAFWDLSYAHHKREVSPFEQQVHSFLELLPFMGLVLIVFLHWDQFIALFGFGQPRFELIWKQGPLPSVTYIVVMLTAVLLFELLPYLEELVRGLRYRAGRRRT